MGGLAARAPLSRRGRHKRRAGRRAPSSASDRDGGRTAEAGRGAPRQIREALDHWPGRRGGGARARGERGVVRSGARESGGRGDEAPLVRVDKVARVEAEAGGRARADWMRMRARTEGRGGR